MPATIDDVAVQGGTTYCAIAALSLVNTLPSFDFAKTYRWLAERLVEAFANDPDDSRLDDERNEPILGYQGRPEKIPDTCYCFWVAASIQVSLHTLSIDQLVIILILWLLHFKKHFAASEPAA